VLKSCGLLLQALLPGLLLAAAMSKPDGDIARDRALGEAVWNEDGHFALI
jgi:hypothetical protein